MRVNDSHENDPGMKEWLTGLGVRDLGLSFGAIVFPPLLAAKAAGLADQARRMRERGVPYALSQEVFSTAKAMRKPADLGALEITRCYLRADTLRELLNPANLKDVTVLAYGLVGRDANNRPFDIARLPSGASERAADIKRLYRALDTDPRVNKMHKEMEVRMPAWQGIMLTEAAQAAGISADSVLGPVFDRLPLADAIQLFKRLAGQPETQPLSQAGQGVWQALEQHPVSKQHLTDEVNARRDFGPGLVLQSMLRDVSPREAYPNPKQPR